MISSFLIICSYVLLRAIMIKESFLRNYSLSKIYNQAEDQKNKLKVFYLRKVRKILKEKHDKERITQREKMAETNKEERLKKRIQNKIKTEASETKEGQIQSHPHRRTDSEVENKQKVKTDLNVVELKFDSDCDEALGFLLKNEKLKLLKIKSSINVLHSQKNSNDELHLKKEGFQRKNTIIRYNTPRVGTADVYQGCRSNEIKFHSDALSQHRAKAKFLHRLKENIDVKKMIGKVEPTPDNPS